MYIPVTPVTFGYILSQVCRGTYCLVIFCQNNRSLLQKSPVKETIFYKRDLLCFVLACYILSCYILFRPVTLCKRCAHVGCQKCTCDMYMHMKHMYHAHFVTSCHRYVLVHFVTGMCICRVYFWHPTCLTHIFWHPTCLTHLLWDPTCLTCTSDTLHVSHISSHTLHVLLHGVTGVYI